jgi:hypothetical protein
VAGVKFWNGVCPLGKSPREFTKKKPSHFACPESPEYCVFHIQQNGGLIALSRKTAATAWVLNESTHKKSYDGLELPLGSWSSQLLFAA